MGREDGGQVVGYLLLDVVAGAAHIEQVSGDPTHARRRIGAQLIEAAGDWARHHGLRAMTLTGFALVPRNAPYYTRLGLAVLPDEAQSPELREIRRTEAERGLDTWPRVAVRRSLK